MKHTSLVSLLILPLITATAMAGPRTSTNYNVATDTADSGGKRATSTSYTNDGSAGGITGISTVTSPAETAKHGYLGQLYDIVGLVLNPTSASVNEGGSLQLSAGQLLDDATQLAVPSASVAWSVAAGPLTGINISGLATAAAVYQNTPATAQGIYTGNIGTLPLTVLNVNLDNYGAYAGDKLDDAWQVQYFGQPPNANGGPLVDFDGDGQNNAFEYTAGLIPTNPLSRFLITIAPVPGQSTQKQVVFDPIVAGRSYTVKTSPDLSAASWTTLTGATTSDLGSQRTVTDTSATPAKKFYTVEIVKP